MDDHINLWKELRMAWGVINASERTIELLRNDIRRAFDGLDHQAKAVAAANAHIGTAFDQTSDRITKLVDDRVAQLEARVAGLEAAACSSDDACPGENQCARPEACDEVLAHRIHICYGHARQQEEG